MDREKVIKGLESLHTRLLDMAMQERIIMLDVSMVANAIDLLKEQEAVKPTIDEYGNKRCSYCGHKLQSIADPDLFCCKCGKPVLWEGR